MNLPLCMPLYHVGTMKMTVMSPLCLIFLFFAFCSFPKTLKWVAVRRSHCSRCTTLSHMVLCMWNLPPWVAFNLSDHWRVTPQHGRALLDNYGSFESILNSFHSKTELNAFSAAHAYSCISLGGFLYITFFVCVKWSDILPKKIDWI